MNTTQHTSKKRSTKFKSKGHTFFVEESFSGTTPNNNVWVLNDAGNHWDWKMLTNWDYERLVRVLKRQGIAYLEE